MNSSMVTLFGITFNIYGAAILLLFLVFAWGLIRAQRKGQLDWTDMLTRDGSKVSTTKVLQLVGGVVGTWIMIQLTMQEKLTWDMFAIYLGYVASIDGYSKLIMAKYGSAASDDSAVPYKKIAMNRVEQDEEYYEPIQTGARKPRPFKTNGSAKTPDAEE